MNKFEQLIANLSKKKIERTLKINANNTSSSLLFQPKVPANLSKFKNK